MGNEEEGLKGSEWGAATTHSGCAAINFLI